MRFVSLLNIDDVKELYAERMKDDFPAAELRPYRAMKQLAKNDQYVCYGYWDGDVLLAYACFLSVDDNPLILLDLLAVDVLHRDQGIGHEFLDLLKQQITKDILIEVESLSSAKDEQQLKERKRRINFYLDNKAINTNIACKLFNVDYDLLILSNNLNNYDNWLTINDFYQKAYKKVFGLMCQPYKR